MKISSAASAVLVTSFASADPREDRSFLRASGSHSSVIAVDDFPAMFDTPKDLVLLYSPGDDDFVPPNTHLLPPFGNSTGRGGDNNDTLPEISESLSCSVQNVIFFQLSHVSCADTANTPLVRAGRSRIRSLSRGDYCDSTQNGNNDYRYCGDGVNGQYQTRCSYLCSGENVHWRVADVSSNTGAVAWEIVATGGDAALIDYAKATSVGTGCSNGPTVTWGRPNNRVGWCLSTDRNDWSGNFRDYVHVNDCFRYLRFATDGNVYGGQ
eukprot:CAMPEP_0196130060 /NCGR_PEP_ID=MMETSP0910-20130528/561_1 /TAXON_ID=49265 /ORGANISM="Thalassiosira rotula, Strain GSO102" /LENGTH=266 /DNA_ID=CAMNT_0041389287 /DNA_START=51 /DNA_END=851 /DNA_ORIENTATION=-